MDWWVSMDGCIDIDRGPSSCMQCFHGTAWCCSSLGFPRPLCCNFSVLVIGLGILRLVFPTYILSETKVPNLGCQCYLLSLWEILWLTDGWISYTIRNRNGNIPQREKKTSCNSSRESLTTKLSSKSMPCLLTAQCNQHW